MALHANPAVTENPYISRMFLECDFNKVGREGNVLVVETSLKPRYDDRRLDDLLMGLNEIQASAQRSIGSFDRIDIRFV
jgi:hypothetical protein